MSQHKLHDLVLALLAMACTGPLAYAQPRKPNIVVILSDDKD
jgi:hypothetical protein